jgi:hypothetical protein
MLTMGLLKLMQQQVLPSGWKGRTIQMLRQKALRLVGKVTKSARQLTLKVRASIGQIDKLRTVRRLIYQLAWPAGLRGPFFFNGEGKSWEKKRWGLELLYRSPKFARLEGGNRRRQSGKTGGRVENGTGWEGKWRRPRRKSTTGSGKRLYIGNQAGLIDPQILGSS